MKADRDAEVWLLACPLTLITPEEPVREGFEALNTYLCTADTLLLKVTKK
jgi:hypothetical protein